MMKPIILSTGLLLFALSGQAQESFLKRIYFPLSFGINYPIGNPAMTGKGISSTDAEFRAGKNIPWFVRLSLDNLTYDYSIETTVQTNVTKSELKAAGYFLGPGIRTRSGKLKFLGLLQAGCLDYRYPIVAAGGTTYEVQYNHQAVFACKALFGAEFYLAEDFAVIAEAHYMLVPASTDFWGSNFQNAGISLGITCPLF